jgi:hypothetical protein
MLACNSSHVCHAGVCSEGKVSSSWLATPAMYAIRVCDLKVRHLQVQQSCHQKETAEVQNSCQTNTTHTQTNTTHTLEMIQKQKQTSIVPPSASVAITVRSTSPAATFSVETP